MVLDTTLRSIPLFSQLREGDIWRIRGAASTRSYPKDSIILAEENRAELAFTPHAVTVPVEAFGIATVRLATQ